MSFCVRGGAFVRVLGVLLALTLGRAALGDNGTFYLDGASTATVRDGRTPETAWRYPSEVSIPPGRDHTLLIAGDVRDPDPMYLGIRINGRPGITVKQWPGRQRAILWGDWVVPGPWTLENEGNEAGAGGVAVQTRRTTLPVGTDPASVWLDYAKSQLPDGRKFGRMRQYWSEGELFAVRYGWLFDPATRRLSVTLPATRWEAVLVGTSELTLVGSGFTRNGIQIGAGCDGFLLEDLAGYNWATEGGASYAFQTFSANGTFRRLETRETGYHGIGAIGKPVGLRFEDCVAWGSFTYRGSTAFVVYTGNPGSGVEANVRDVVLERCVSHCYPHLDPEGEPVTLLVGSGAFLSHGGGPMKVEDIEYRDCLVVNYEPTDASGGFNANDVAEVAIADKFDWRQYPVRHLRCEVRGGNGMIVQVRHAFERCRLVFDRFGSSDFFGGSVVYGGGPVLFSSTEVLHDMDRDERPGNSWGVFVFFGDEPDGELVFLNSTVLNTGTDPSRVHALLAPAYRSGRTITARQSVFGHVFKASGGYLLAQDESTSDAQVDFNTNAYVGITGAFGRGGRSTAAQFLANIDNLPGVEAGLVIPAGGAAGSFEEPGVTGEPRRGTTLWTARRRADRVGAVGLNGRAFSEMLGAWQFGGACAADRNGDGVVNSLDIAAFITTWQSDRAGGAARSDVNGDGAVNSLDIGEFVTRWQSARRDGCAWE